MSPLRTVHSWELVANPDSARRERFPQVWLGRLACGHIVNFGAGPKPTAKQWRCGECSPVEAEAA